MEIDERTVRDRLCQECGLRYDHVTGFVKRDGSPLAVYFAYCHGHPEHEAGIDVVLGTWGVEAYTDHVTFSCLLRSHGAMTVDATVAVEGAGDDPILGQKLTRATALVHPWIADFWAVVDAIATGDKSVAQTVYGDGHPSH